MSTQIAFLPRPPKNLEAPTVAEIMSASVIINGAFIDAAPAFKQAAESVQRYAYETSKKFSIQFTMTSREHRRMQTRMARMNRRMQTRMARMNRRPALIHKGRKP